MKNLSSYEKKRAIIFCRGLRKRYIDDLGGLDFLEQNFDFFIDISAHTKPNQSERNYDDFITNSNLRIAHGLVDLFQILRRENIGFCLAAYLEWSTHQYRLVALLNAMRVRWGIVFLRINHEGLFSEAKDSGSISKAPKRLYKKIRRRLLGIGGPGFLISNDLRGLQFNYVNASTRRYAANHLDYYKVHSQPKVECSNYFVFLDQSFPFHLKNHQRDSMRMAFDRSTTQRYYETLNRLLNKFSREKELSVVVCLHPNAPAGEEQFFDSSFTVVRGQSARYARSAEHIVTQLSTASIFAHMFDTPLTLFSLKGFLPQELDIRTENKALNEGATLWELDAHGEIVRQEGLTSNSGVIRDYVVPVPQNKSIQEHLSAILEHEWGPRTFRERL